MKNLILIFSFFCICACTKQDRENTIIDQEKNIDAYITGLGEDAKVIRNGGSNRIIVKEGEGDGIVRGDSVIFYFAAYIFSNSGKGELFATNNKDVAKENNFNTDGVQQRKILGEKSLLAGLNNGLEGVKKGEVCNILFSAKYGYGNTVVYNVPKLSPLFFEIWIESVVKN